MRYRYRSSTLFPLALMLILAGLTFWLERVVQFPEVKHETVKRHDPDFVVERFQLMKLDQDGAQHYRLSAEKMTHYPDDETTVLEQPKLDQTQQGSPTIYLSAKRGTITKNADHVFFYDDVLALREATVQEEPLRIMTNFLQIIPDLDTAKTDKPVVIQQGKSILKGVGMEFNKETRIFKLLSQVEGNFEPRTVNAK